MNEMRTFHSDADRPALMSMDGLKLELSGPKAAPTRFVFWSDGNEEWKVSLDEMLAPLDFFHRTLMDGYAFDELHPEGAPIQRWSAWMEEFNEELNERLLNFREDEEGFKFLLAMDAWRPEGLEA